MENNGENILSNSNDILNGESTRNMGNKILKPIRQEKIVKVPVTQYVEKIIEKEQIKYVNKYVDVIKPIITYKTKHVSKPIYLDKIKYETKVIEKEKIIHVPKIEYRNKIVEIPVYVHREKIIEKQVPLVIERVIPILKVRNLEKTVLTDNITIPEICEVKHLDHSSKCHGSNNVQNHIINNTPLKNSAYVVNYTPDIRHIKENPSNMKTYRLNQENSLHSNIKIEENHIIQNKKTTFPDSSYGCESSYGDSLNGKNETVYEEGIHPEEYVNEDEEDDEEVEEEEEEERKEEQEQEEVEEEHEQEKEEKEQEEKEQEEQEQEEKEQEQQEQEEKEQDTKNVKYEEYKQNEKYENKYNFEEGYNTQNNLELNTLSVNVHFPETNNEFQSSTEQKYSINYGNNQNMVSNGFYDINNNIHMNCSNTNQNSNSPNMFQGSEYNYNEKKEFSEQVINSNASGAYKLYPSFPINANYGANFEYITKEPIQREQNYAMNYTDMQVGNENYNQSLQDMHLHNTIVNRQSFRPTYANANGQSIISIRPAVIVESKAKGRKPKLSMCNFLNCCGGNQ